MCVQYGSVVKGVAKDVGLCLTEVCSPGGAMEEFIKHFRRESGGVWVCVSPATLELTPGRVQVTAGTRFTIGTKFMNVDLARMLDEEYSRLQKR